MSKRTLICLAAAANLAIAGAACSSARGDEREAGARPSGSGDEVTIAGCLSGENGNFVLTAAPDAAVAATERAFADERETHSYVLNGGSNLQEHIGKRVEVVGHIVGGEREFDHDAKAKTEAPASGKDTPTVATKEEIEVEVRQLNVSQVRPTSGNCTLTP